MNILVTGSNGQLGSEIQLQVPLHKGWHFFFTDVEELDITKPEDIRTFIRKNNINFIINCAAFTAVDKAESQEELCDLLNHKAPGFLAEAIQEAGGSLIHISTDYVFDGTNHTPYKENVPTCPNSVYGHTKLKGEQAVTAACPSAVIIRTAWLYSIFGNNFVKTMIRLGKEKEELGVIFDQIGTPTYAADLAKVILEIIKKSPIPGIYHFSNEGVCSWYDFTKTIHRLSGINDCRIKPLHTEEYPTPAKRPHYSVLDKTKIKKTFDIDIPWWEESLKICIDKLKK
ncbi:dTDP-4-dehydrorhamnose reductase [Alloprevotella rava F0323]|uniref:dTDP-4-dehydrorhamnose reductase n=1 Tax=Alloprevotella rava F0323 TaxID=679199 RepID=G5G9X9_9BACT|nr:dTDP-4-dehydrorhamnose reductase [Alloprevotella rava]EHG24179.1 dTDP-4-dehydrorhamnose reductase [Alloprevotella rava F0323]